MSFFDTTVHVKRKFPSGSVAVVPGAQRGTQAPFTPKSDVPFAPFGQGASLGNIFVIFQLKGGARFIYYYDTGDVPTNEDYAFRLEDPHAYNHEKSTGGVLFNPSVRPVIVEKLPY
jgi:hypothetical protein